MKRKKITAYLRFNGFESKIKTEFLPEIRTIVTLPMTISFLQEAFVPNSPNRHPVLVFEWKKQLTKYTHEYSLKEIKL